MGLRYWLEKLFGKAQPSPELVPYLDTESGRVVRIPAAELRPGTIQVQLQTTGELVWVLAGELKQSEIRHAEFDEEVRDYIRRIQYAFEEHRTLTFEEWEEGFRRDANPEREIAFWSYAADIYTEFTKDEPDASRREDIYNCIVACMVTGPDAVWKVLRPEVLSRAEAEQLVNRFFGKKA